MRKIIIRTALCIVTLALVAISVKLITDKFEDRQVGSYYQFKGYYDQVPGTIDVLFVGSSRIHTNINPAELWEDYGIASYALGLNAQPANTSYYSIKEALKYQHPKVLVFEASQIDYTHTKTDLPPVVYGMKHDLNYYGAIGENRHFESVMDYGLFFPVCHTRYDSINKETFVSDSFRCYPQTRGAGYKGAVEYYHVEVQPEPSLEYIEEGQLFPQCTEDDFDRIVKLCADENIELLITLTPAAYRFDIVGVTDYVSRKNVKFVNTSDYFDEIGLDVANDFIDPGHLNINGSYKTSRFIGKYLKDNYNLEDHRGDSRYASWDENVTYHYQKIANNELPKINGFGTYLDNFPNENYIVIVSLLNGYDSEYIGQTDALAHVLCNEVVYELGGTWIEDGRSLLYGSFGYCDDENEPDSAGGISIGKVRSELGEGAKMVACDWHFDVGNRTIEVTRDESGRKIMVDGVDYAVCKPNSSQHINDGIEIVVYDKLSEKVVDAVCFDASNGWAATRNANTN